MRKKNNKGNFKETFHLEKLIAMVSSNSIYIKSPYSLNLQAWLKEGLILQTDKGIFLGEGPFISSDRPGWGFFHSDFFLEKKQAWIFPQKVFFTTTRAFIENRLDNAVIKSAARASMKRSASPAIQGEHSLPSQKMKEPPSFTEFHTVFAQLQQKFKQNTLKKGVLVLFERMKGKVCVLTLLKILFQKTAPISHEGFLYGVWNAKGGMLGFTPETLFSFSGRNISLMALAGTAPWPGPSLLHDPKEMREHQWVIQSLKEALGNKVTWNTFHTKEKKFGDLKHLCTNIKGILKPPVNFTLLCRTLHPTAALGGFPKQAALHWLKTNPPQKNRGHFGAPFGFFNGKDRGFCLVALRGVEWDSEGLRLGSGCGLVENSVLQKEWRELTLKRNQIKQFYSL